MPVNVSDALGIWEQRGWLAPGSQALAVSYIEQARAGLLARCNIPARAPVPDGLLHAWADVSHVLMTAAQAGGGRIKSVSDGDTTVTYGDAGASQGTGDVFIDTPGVAAAIQRHRRMP